MLYSHQKLGRALAECHRRVLWPATIHLNNALGNYKHDRVWLIGSARSGTTWVPRLINWDRRYREITEPFNPKTNRSIWQHYVRPGADSPRLAELLERVFSGRPVGRQPDWGTAASAYDDLFIKHRGLFVKDVTAQLLARWAMNRLADVKLIYIVRNPLAVALSRYKRKDWFRPEPELATLEQPELVEDWLQPFDRVIAEYKNDDFYRKVVLWAVENYVFMRQFKSDELLALFYEDVVRYPLEQLGRIYDYIGHDRAKIDPKAVERLRQSKSRTTVVDGADKWSPLTTWQQELSDEQISRSREILAEFRLAGLYGRDGQPNPDRLLFS